MVSGKTIVKNGRGRAMLTSLRTGFALLIYQTFHWLQDLLFLTTDHRIWPHGLRKECKGGGHLCEQQQCSVHIRQSQAMSGKTMGSVSQLYPIW